MDNEAANTGTFMDERQSIQLRKRNEQLFLKDYFTDDYNEIGMSIPYHLLEEADSSQRGSVLQYREYFFNLRQ